MNIELVPGTIADYPVIQNMAKYYVYDASRDCGFEISEDENYEPNDYQAYFKDPDKKAFLIKVNDELAGFVLIRERGIFPETDYKIDQFFILAKFQRKGIGKQVACQIWEKYIGIWEVSVLPENTRALAFWRKAIPYQFVEKIVDVDFDEGQPQRIILSVKSVRKKSNE